MSTEEDQKTTTPAMDNLKHIDEKLDNLSDDIDFGGESSLPPPPTLTPQEEQRLWRKVDRRLMPILTLMYLLSFLDRGELHHEHHASAHYLMAVFYRKYR